MRRDYLMNIGLALGSIVLFLLAIEFGLRITGLQSVAPNPPKIYQKNSDPNISYSLRPDLRNEKAYKATVSTDEHGFRLNAPKPIPNDHSTIAVIGDSIAFGHGVGDEQSLPARLEHDKPEYHFLNAAVPGYQLQQETAMYVDNVRRLKPEGVMLVFYWNDLDGIPPAILDEKGILRNFDWKPGDDHCNPITEGVLGLIPGKCWLDTHSAFYKAFKKLMNLKASKESQLEEREQEAAQEPFRREQIAAYLSQLRAAARELPAKRWFVIWPDNFEHTDVRKELTDTALQLGFTVIDLYELFGNHAETLSWDTVHPSPKSIDEAAQFISDRM